MTETAPTGFSNRFPRDCRRQRLLPRQPGIVRQANSRQQCRDSSSSNRCMTDSTDRLFVSVRNGSGSCRASSGDRQAAVRNAGTRTEAQIPPQSQSKSAFPRPAIKRQARGCQTQTECQCCICRTPRAAMTCLHRPGMRGMIAYNPAGIKPARPADQPGPNLPFVRPAPPAKAGSQAGTGPGRPQTRSDWPQLRPRP